MVGHQHWAGCRDRRVTGVIRSEVLPISNFPQRDFLGLWVSTSAEWAFSDNLAAASSPRTLATGLSYIVRWPHSEGAQFVADRLPASGGIRAAIEVLHDRRGEVTQIGGEVGSHQGGGQSRRHEHRLSANRVGILLESRVRAQAIGLGRGLVLYDLRAVIRKLVLRVRSGWKRKVGGKPFGSKPRDKVPVRRENARNDRGDVEPAGGLGGAGGQ